MLLAVQSVSTGRLLESSDFWFDQIFLATVASSTGGVPTKALHPRPPPVTIAQSRLSTGYWAMQSSCIIFQMFCPVTVAPVE